MIRAKDTVELDRDFPLSLPELAVLSLAVGERAGRVSSSPSSLLPLDPASLAIDPEAVFETDLSGT